MNSNQKHQLSTALINAATQIEHYHFCTGIKTVEHEITLKQLQEAQKTLDTIPTELDFKVDETFLSDVHRN